MRFSKEEQREWLNGQAAKPLSAAVLFLNEAGEVLLVKPNYRDTWNLPGGIVDENESPLDGAVREVKEELGLDIKRSMLRLSSVDYRPARDGFTDKLYFYFRGVSLDRKTISQIHLQADEIEEMRFVSMTEAQQLLGKWTHRQVTEALTAKDYTAYLERGVPTYQKGVQS